MKVIPVTLQQAKEFVLQYHRHHKEPPGHRFSIGCTDEGRVVGVATIARPVARNTPQYTVAEVSRLCTDGTHNACSFLYAASARICKEMGYSYIQTFILPTESGVSLKAAGWKFDGISHKATWQNRTGRRTDQPTEPKQRWIKELNS